MRAVVERPVDDDDLQAMIDGHLTADRQQFVDDWLETNPKVAARVQRDRDLREELRTQLASKLAEPIPRRLRIATIVAERRRSRRVALLRIAAALALLVAGGAGGWIANEVLSGGGLGLMATGSSGREITADAVAAHRLFVAEPRHPVEVGVAEEAHLVRWLSNRLGRPLPPPNLSAQGFRLMGGRLLPGTADGPAAQLMYVDAGGTRLTVYLRAAASDGTTEFRFAQENGVNAFWWTDRGFAYAISAAVERGRLLDIAEAAYRELDRPPN